MKTHNVKCYYCGNIFDANKEQFVKVNSTRYAHKSCQEERDKVSGFKDDNGLEIPTTASNNKMKKVKCIYCNRLFPLDSTDYKMVGNRYAHTACYNTFHSPDDDYISKIYQLIKTVFGPGYDYKKIEAQRARMINDGITNQDIYNSLYYFYIVQKHSIARANGGINIVPYIVEDARDYFESIQKYSEKVHPNTFKMGSKVVKVSALEETTNYQDKLKNRFSIDPNSLKDLE